jgi:hypothetical protein
MTMSSDADRRISAWFEEGPERISESTIDAVLAHAQAHPRRRDPLQALRRDPMGGRGMLAGLFAAPVPLLAALGLLVALAVAGLAAGGYLERPSGLVPPTASPAPPSASVGPSSSVTPSPPPEGGFQVDLIENVGADAFVDVVDRSGTVVDGTSGDPGFGASVEPERVQVTADPADPAVLELRWSGSPCDTAHRLEVAPDGRTMALTRPPCDGDSTPVDHVLRLTFDPAMDPGDVTITLSTTDTSP